MNCKPGDLAVIVNPGHPLLADLIGRIIRVKRVIAIDVFGDPCWSYEGKPIEHALAGTLDAASDAWLFPIRPNGITDDEVRELYAPKLPEVA